MESKSIALIIDKAGKILATLFNNTFDFSPENRLFPTLLFPSEFSSGLDFLNQLRKNAIVVDFPLTLNTGDSPQSFYFTGVKQADSYVLIGSNNQQIDATVYDEIAKVNNELANQLRDSMKESMRKASTIDEPQLEDFSRLNNELVNIQRELNKSHKQLEVLNEQKNQLIGIAAHDLRNPLGVISGYIQFVKGTSTNLDDGQIQMLDKAVETANKMTTMLEELLDMSELESGKVTLNLKDVDLDEIVTENVELNQVIADRKAIEIHYDSPGKMPVRLDPSKIEQVINNFVSNAIKYSHPNTHIFVTLQTSDSQLKFSVRDEGQGIPEAEIPAVFEPFQTTSVKATGGEKSTGLGLAITKKVIEAHKGAIDVKSKVGQGTEFYFTLPIE